MSSKEPNAIPYSVLDLALITEGQTAGLLTVQPEENDTSSHSPSQAKIFNYIP